MPLDVLRCRICYTHESTILAVVATCDASPSFDVEFDVEFDVVALTRPSPLVSIALVSIALSVARRRSPPSRASLARRVVARASSSSRSRERATLKRV